MAVSEHTCTYKVTLQLARQVLETRIKKDKVNAFVKLKDGHLIVIDY